MEEEFGDSLEIEWRSFLLRPSPVDKPDLARFVRYTQSWLRPAAEPDAPPFRVWESAEGPPSHSIPPHLVAKAAASLGDDCFRDIHHRLLRAYFSENRDITAPATLRAIWCEAGLPEAEFERRESPALLEETLGQHAEAVERGITGVPATAVVGSGAHVLGAQPEDLYRHWIQRLQAGILDSTE